MAVGVRGVGTANGSGSATTNISASQTPNTPAGLVATDRAMVGCIGTGNISAPASWQTLLASTPLGGGVDGDTTGVRQAAVFYRDYDGAWSMPSITTDAVSAVGPGIELFPLAFSKAAGEVFNTPTIGTGSDTTSGTGFSAATGSFSDPTGAIAWLIWVWPGSPGTLSALTLSAPGATFAGNTSRHGVNGQTTGRDVQGATWTYPVTTGAIAVHTSGVTGTTARTGGIVVVSQTVSPATSQLTPPPYMRLNPLLVR